MQSILHSAFLQALGYAIFNSLWQVALLWLIVMLVNGLANLSASRKYYVAVTAQFAGFVWFLFTLQFYYAQCNTAISSLQSAGLAVNDYYFYEPIVHNFSSGVTYAIIKTEQLIPYLSAAYIVMLLFLAGRLIRALLYVKQIKTKGLSKPGVEWKLFVKRTADYLGIKKEVSLYFSGIISSPLTIGFLKPVILLPVASINHLSTDQLEAILLHELAHIRRADYLINIVLCTIETVLFFNPFTHLLGKFIKRERENSCDDWVLQFQYKPAMYAEALLRIATLQVQPAFTMQAAAKQELLPRVKRMLNQKEKNYQYRNHILAFLLITVMLTTVAWYTPPATNYKPAQQAATASEKKMMIEPLTANVENPFYNPFYYVFDNVVKQQIEKALTISGKNAALISATTADAMEKATPVAIKSVQSAYDEISKSLPGIQAEINKSLDEASMELVNLHIDDLTLADSPINIALNAPFIKDALAGIDWTAISNDLSKAKADISNNVNKDVVEKLRFKNLLKEITIQLSELSDDKKMKDQQKMRLKIQADEDQKEQELKIETLKKDAETQRKVHAKLQPLKVWSDIEREDVTTYGIDDTAVNNALFNSNATIQSNFPASLASAVSFNSEAPLTNVNVEPSPAETIPGSAVIIIQHDADNENSHIKHIIIKVAGTNGVTKTYRLSAEVYQ